MRRHSYFLVAVSNRFNLDLCIRHALAGFSNSGTGVWAYLDIQEGDYISFLYAARALNLYRVLKKEALVDFLEAPPWPPVTFRQSGKTYYYPFRLLLKRERALNEPIVRTEFAYVAENLLLRAGYRKTHFQADQTTLQLVSQMGSLSVAEVHELEMPHYSTFIPRFTRRKSHWKVPQICPFNELILQVALRHQIAEDRELARLLEVLHLELLDPRALEVLGERAVSEGHVDILIKDSVPIGTARKVVLETKLGRAKVDDLSQLNHYTDEFGPECIGRALIAHGFPRAVISEASRLGIHLLAYELDCDWDQPKPFQEIQERLRLVPVL